MREKTKSELDKRFQKIMATPASFDFFVAIHDFVKYIELTPALSRALSSRSKANQEANIPGKYGFLREIYQGLEDIERKSESDLGHSRYMVIRELTQIQNKEASESNSFWKKRELLRKSTGLVYRVLDAHLSGGSAKEHLIENA